MRKPWRIVIISAIFVSILGAVLYIRAELTTPDPGFESLEGFAVQESTHPEIEQSTETTPVTNVNEAPPQDDAEKMPEERSIQSEVTEPTVEASTEPAIEPFVMTGKLNMKVDGASFGEEEYQLRRYETGEYELISTGFFAFKVVVVKTKFHFQQAIAWDSELFPNKIAFNLKGPLGVGSRNLEAAFLSESPYRSAVITSGKDQSQVRLPDGPVAIQGTFSSFSIFPLLLNGTDSLDLEIFISNGMGRDDGTAASSVNIKISYAGKRLIRNDSLSMQVDEYMMIRNVRDPEPDQGSLRLLFRDNEFMGVYVESEDSRGDSFQVFRSDIFPNGFEVVQSN